MKLTDITLEHVLPLKHHRIGRLSDGVNIIEGHAGSGKTAIREFVRDVLLGNQRFLHLNHSSYLSSFEAPTGQVSIKLNNNEYRLERNWSDSGQLQVSSNVAGSVNNRDVVDHYLSKVTPEVYETVYSFSLKQTSDGLIRLARVMNGKLGIPFGSAAGDDYAARFRIRELEAKRARLHELRQQLDRLKSRRLECLRTFEHDDTARQARLLELDREIQSISSQFQNQDLNLRRTQLANLEREIAELRAYIEETVRREGSIQPTQVKPNLPDPFQLLYLRLDEIDSQIRRWRRIQNDIQSQRVRLKDEMVVWGGLNLDSAEHPYHNARKVLIALEERINQTDQQAKQWELAPTHHTDPSQSVRTIQALCQSMRHDLQLLSNELGQQYKNIRHRAAAVELKQLRHFYNLISENIERLVRRREQAINEIRFIDSPGAEAILRSEGAFMQCALHEGYLEARRRFAGPLPAMVEPVTQWFKTDLTDARNRLQALQVDANQAQRWIIDYESRQSELKARYNQLVAERPISAAAGRPINSVELRQLDAEIQRLTAEHHELARTIDSDGSYVLAEANPILAKAAQSLQQLTAGEWSRVWLAEPAKGGFVVSGRNGQTISAQLLNPSTQHLVYLAVAFAAQCGFGSQGIDLPTVIDDVSVDFSREQMTHVMSFLNDLQRDGHQLLLLTQHNYFGADTGNFARFKLPAEIEKTNAPFIAWPVVENLVDSRIQSALEPKAAVNYYPVTKSTYTAPDVLSYWVDSGDIDPVTLKHVDSLRVPESVNPSFSANPLSVPVNATSVYPTQVKPYSQTEILELLGAGNKNDYLVSYSQNFSVNQRPVRQFSSVGFTATPTTVEAMGEQTAFAPAFDDSTELERIELLDPPRLRALSEVGVENIGQLLVLTPEDLPVGLRERGISADQVDRWQAIVWMLSIIPGLRVEDAKILVACGVTEPEHLATSLPQQLLERIQRFVGSTEGQRFVPHSPSINLPRINGWLRALQSSSGRWQHRGGFSRHSRRQNPSSTSRTRARRSDRESGQPNQILQEPVQRDSGSRPENFVAAFPIRNDLVPEREFRQPFVARPPRMHTPDPTNRQKNDFSTDRSRRVEREPISIGREAPQREVVRSATIEQKERTFHGDSKLRFYLDLKDHIEAAPSIGPKTAERFERIGVRTVEDFIKQTAESMATKLKYQRITADMIRIWQHQTRLVCRIPNLRGHDAQLLVACNLIEPEKIAAMQPQRLLDIILPFARSKEGLKIVRTGKEPDLQEVSDWIRWAGLTRSIHAA